MTISQPSKLVYVIDVPEVKDFNATFQYNFFTPDECVNDAGGVPAEALARPAALINSDFIQWSLTRVPREVDFSFSLPKIADIGNVVTAQAKRANANRTTGAQLGSLIKDNIDRIVDEDYFSANGFIAVSFHDGEIDNKAHTIVSGALETLSVEQESLGSSSPYKAALNLGFMLPNTIKPHFLFQALTQPKQSYGGTFYTAGPKDRAPAPVRSAKHSATSTRYTSGFFDRLKKVKTNAQINSKLLQDMLVNIIRDPTSTMAAEVSSMHGFAKQAKQSSNHRFSTAVSESDYKTFVPYVSVKKQKAGGHHDKYSAEVVGFIIDKLEVLRGGITKAHDPIIIESPHASSTADFKVKFHADYCYSIRTIAQLTLPAIDGTTGDVATIKILVSSKPSNKVYVSTTKLDAPPPPGDVDLILERENNRLLVTWAFPVWSQQDIKQFQVFRRRTVNEPFQLLKVYNFDDSAVKFPDNEDPDPRVVEFLTSPCQFYFDDEFDVTVNTSQERSFIYAVSCIDAHGLSSSLSAQYRVWYDQFKNVLQKEHVSHLGAPKPYPNLYLDGDVFVDTVKVKGPYSKSMKLYFNPEYYYLYDDQNRVHPVLATAQRGGSYKLQFINLDNGKSHDINIVIDDQIKQKVLPIRRLATVLGPSRPNTALQRTSGG